MGRKKKEASPGDKVVQQEQEAELNKFIAFLDRVKALGIKYRETKAPRYRSWREEKGEPCDPYVTLEWSTGGVSGGSCWDNSDPRPYTSDEPEPEFTDLDKILEDVCPTITFLKYKNLVSEVVSYSTRTENEYYGNCTNYSVKTLDLKKLYDALRSRGFLPE